MAKLGEIQKFAQSVLGTTSFIYSKTRKEWSEIRFNFEIVQFEQTERFFEAGNLRKLC